MINVLYISYDGMTDPLGQSQVIPYLQGLTKFGYHFTILSCEKKDRFNIHKQSIRSILAESNISWQPLMYTKKPPVFSTIYDFLKMKKAALHLHAQEKFAVVHCRSYIPSLIGLYLKEQFNIKFIFDMRGFWADERIDGGLWTLSNPIYKKVYTFFKEKEKQLLNKADAVISLTEAGKNEMKRWENSDNFINKIHVIPCCVDLQLFDTDVVTEAQQSAIRMELGITKNNFILVYLGSIGTWYLLKEMMQCFASIKKNKPYAKFLFITYDEHDKIKLTARSLGLSKNDIILRSAKRKEVPVLLSVSNWSIFFIKPSYSKINSSPTKQAEIMAMGIPVICNKGVGDTDLIITKYNSGIAVSENDETAYSKMDSFQFSSQNIRRGAAAYFSLESGVARYLTIYQSFN